jgi:hypothetical protein
MYEAQPLLHVLLLILPTEYVSVFLLIITKNIEFSLNINRNVLLAEMWHVFCDVGTISYILCNSVSKRLILIVIFFIYCSSLHFRCCKIFILTDKIFVQLFGDLWQKFISNSSKTQENPTQALRFTSILWSELKAYNRTVYYLITFWTTAYEQRMICVWYQKQGLYHFVE